MPDVLYPEEQQQIQTVCQRLSKDANANAVLLIAKDGQTIADAGETRNLDITSFASLAAGNVAATGGISKLLSEKEFTSQYHEGEKTHVHLSLVHQRAILVVLFDNRTSLGLVRLRVKKAADELARIFDTVNKKAQSQKGQSIFSEITDDDIDNLFSD